MTWPTVALRMKHSVEEESADTSATFSLELKAYYGFVFVMMEKGIPSLR